MIPAEYDPSVVLSRYSEGKRLYINVWCKEHFRGRNYPFSSKRPHVAAYILIRRMQGWTYSRIAKKTFKSVERIRQTLCYCYRCMRKDRAWYYPSPTIECKNVLYKDSPILQAHHETV